MTPRKVFSRRRDVAKRAAVDVVDVVLAALERERARLCHAMAQQQPDRTKLTRRLVASCEAIAYAKHEREEIIQDPYFA